MSPCFSRLRLSMLLGAIAFAAGCGGELPVDSEEGLGTASEAINGGYIDEGDPNVIGIYAAAFGGLCTGSLLTPNMVLTAHHCVAEINNNTGQVQCGVTTFKEPPAASTFHVTTKNVMPMGQTGYVGVKEVILPTPDNKLCGQDLAILILAENIDPAVAKPLVPRIDEELVKGEKYSAVGFGATNDSGAGAGTRRRRDELTIDCVSDACPAFYAEDTEWIGSGGVCQGDSGGPAIDLQGRVIGVTSRGGAGCTSPIYGYVHSWAEWVKETAVHAAEVGNYTAPPWVTGWPTNPDYSYPSGDACKEPADCASGRCINDGVAQYCTRACAENAPCPDGYFCGEDSGGQGVCFKEEPPPGESADASTDSGSCSMGADPTKPVPWRSGLVALAFVALGLRRRAR